LKLIFNAKNLVNLLQKSTEKPESLYMVVSVFIKILFPHVTVYVSNNTILAVCVDSPSVPILSNL